MKMHFLEMKNFYSTIFSLVHFSFISSLHSLTQQATRLQLYEDGMLTPPGLVGLIASI